MKSDLIFERLSEDAADGVHLNFAKRLFVRIYPFFHLAYETAILSFYFAYVVGLSR